MQAPPLDMRADFVQGGDEQNPRYVAASLGEHGHRQPLRFLDRAQIFDAYLLRTPLAYALFRGSECSALRGLDIQRPVLDLGSSTGELATWALDGQVEAGVDLSQSRLKEAFARGGHSCLAQADATSLPFADASFASVLAVSVCEHLAAPAAALSEAFRVLRPGGRFVATIVLDDIHQHLFYSGFCRRLGLRWMAGAYERLHDRVFDHVALHQRADWERMLEAAGFRLVEGRSILSPRLIRSFDRCLITAWPYKLTQWLGMRPIVWRPRWMARRCWNWFQSINDDPGDKGGVLLVVAERPR